MEISYFPKDERERWKKTSLPQVEKVVLDRLGDRGKTMIEQAEKLK